MSKDVAHLLKALMSMSPLKVWSSAATMGMGRSTVIAPCTSAFALPTQRNHQLHLRITVSVRILLLFVRMQAVMVAVHVKSLPPGSVEVAVGQDMLVAHVQRLEQDALGGAALWRSNQSYISNGPQ